MSILDSSCLFCRIIQGSIPSLKVAETAHSLAFLDISPLSRGHVLVIPKWHGQYMHQIPDDCLHECISTLKRIAAVTNPDGNYNILQNNGSLAHQFVNHVHFHLIPKTSSPPDGLVMQWDSIKVEKQEMESIQNEIVKKLSASAV